MKIVAGGGVDDPGDAAAEVSYRLRPSVTSPTVAARQAATLDRSRMVVRCLIWSQAAIHKSWQRRRVP